MTHAPHPTGVHSQLLVVNSTMNILIIIILCAYMVVKVYPFPTHQQASAKTATTSRISKGSAVDPPHKYPFIVELWWSGYVPNQTEPLTDARHGCGASIINKHWLMSAAHCFVNPRNAQFDPTFPIVKTALTGMHRAGKLEPWSQNITILEYIGPSILHRRKGYFNKYHSQDIVLIRLATPIIFSDKVTPVNLPPIDWEVDEDFKDNATVIGWGQIVTVEGFNATFTNADELQEISLPLVTTETCQRRAGLFRYNKTRGVFWESFEAPVFQICLSLRELRPEEPLGACFGDSGSPALVFNSKYATYFQVGIVAYGHCWHDTPYLYTNVAKYVNWIRWNTELCHWRNVSRSYGP